MEALYLLYSIVSTSLTSFALSLLLLFRRLFPSRAAGAPDSVSLYQGTVWHERRRPVHHSFKYSVKYALIDLDHDHAPPDHLSTDEARRFAETNGPVTNTPWGERVLFLFNPNSDFVAKPLHVSPFMDMLGNWSIRTSVPGDNLLLTISIQHPKLGDYFTASLTAKRVSSSATDHAVFFWLMPHKVALWIYWHVRVSTFLNLEGLIFFLGLALKLWWKGVPFIQHPRYNNPLYREQASVNDKKLQCCPAFAPNHSQVEGSDSGFMADTIGRERWFQWRDAKWPWC
ncbi:hypothetical protein LguiB_033884 [Lonicera macranthoides]